MVDPVNGPDTLAEHVAVVTGGASGLGLATAARLLAGQGARIAAIDLSAQALERLTPQESIVALAADVSNADDMEAAFAQVHERLGVPSILVNCAGVLGPARVFKVDKHSGQVRPRALDVFRRVIETNLIGTFNAVRLFAAGLSNASAHMVRALIENGMMNGSVVRIDGAVRMREPVAPAASGDSR